MNGLSTWLEITQPGGVAVLVFIPHQDLHMREFFVPFGDFLDVVHV